MTFVEEWRSVVFNDLYEVSNMGKVRSYAYKYRTPKHLVTPKELSLLADKEGYLHVNVGGKDSLVHRLVTTSFLGPCPSGHSVDHIDKVRYNNTLSNLRYVTIECNTKQATVPRRLLSAEQVMYIRSSGVSSSKLAKQLSVDINVVKRIKSGTTYKEVVK